MIHVCFSLHDEDGRYSKFTGTAILSMFEMCPAPPPCITVHILHDNTLADDNREKFLSIAESYGQLIKFYNVEKTCAEEIESIKKFFENDYIIKRLTIGSVYRLLIPQIISPEIKKLIYLDSDLIVHMNIDELWQIEIGNKPLAATPEFEQGRDSGNFFSLCREGRVKPEDYFNSGVLVINEKKIRQDEMENIWRGIKYILENPEHSEFGDQEILNYCFSKNYLRLPKKFNFLMNMPENVANEQIDRRIYHYCGQTLNLNQNAFNRLWFKYFEKTPWFTKEVIAHIDEGYKKIINQQNEPLKNFKDFALQLTASIFGKTRAFFADVSNMNVMKQTFYIKDDEDIIPFVNQESFQILADSMYNSRGKKIFFILFRDYEQLRSALTSAGFVEEEDFINAAIFLQDTNGSLLDTYSLVKAM